MYSWSIVSNKHTSITRYDCIDLNFRQINTVIESLPLPCLRIVVLYHWHNKLFSKSCYRWVLIILVREYGVPLYVGLLTTGVVLLHHIYIYKGTNYWKKLTHSLQKGPIKFHWHGPMGPYLIIPRKYPAILVLIFGVVYRVFCVDTLLKVVSHYDLSVLCMWMMGFLKHWIEGWVGGMSLSSFYLDFLNFLTLQSPYGL